jgi:hypothetical protein
MIQLHPKPFHLAVQPPAQPAPRSSNPGGPGLTSHGDAIATAVQIALIEYLDRRNQNGQLFVPTLRESLIQPPFQYVVFDDQKLYHHHRSQLVGQGALNAISSALYQSARLKARAFGFMPEDCDSLRAQLEREGHNLPFGVTYIIPLVPLPLLVQQNSAAVQLPTNVELDLGQFERDQLILPIGISANGPVTLALNKVAHHLLFVGETQSGKTTGLHTMLYALTKLNSPSVFQFALASPKENENAFWNGSPHLWHAIVSGQADMLGLIEQVHAEVERRAKLFAQSGRLCSTIGEWHALCSPEEHLPYLFVVIDETLDYLGGGKLGRDVAERLQRVVRKALAYGILIVLITQHVRDERGKGIPRDIETQFQTRFVWRVADKYASEQAGCRGAEDIPATIPGRLIARIHNRPERVQGYWVEKSVLRAQANLFAQAQNDPQIAAGLTLSDLDRRLLTWAHDQSRAVKDLDYLGLIDIGLVAQVGPREAQRIQARLERDGWLAPDPRRGNKRKLTEKAIALLGGSVVSESVKP